MSKTALVDIDDTLGATQVSILEHANRHSKKKFLFHDMTQEFREGQVAEYERFVQDFLAQSELVLEIEAYPYTGRALEQLSRAGYEIHLVSSRREPLHEVTEQWLNKHDLAKYVDGIHPRYSHQKGIEFKLSTARKINAEIAFDDTLDVAEALSDSGIKTYLIDKPWNRNAAENVNLLRVEDFMKGVSVHLVSV